MNEKSKTSAPRCGIVGDSRKTLQLILVAACAIQPFGAWSWAPSRAQSPSFSSAGSVDLLRMAANEPHATTAANAASRQAAPAASGNRISLWVKLLYSAFVAVLVPCYLWAYGPRNFLYFCDLALLMGLVALWMESALWASMPAVGILLPQLLWMIDFAAGFFGARVTGMTAYMFDSQLSLLLRGLSSFHLWLPFFLVWMISVLGYDPRAFAAWTGLASVVMLVCYFLMPAPPAPADNPNLTVNINYVYGFSDKQPQHWMPPLVYLLLSMILLPLVVYLPTHLVFSKIFLPPAPVG
jgi:hypothetical protein